MPIKSSFKSYTKLKSSSEPTPISEAAKSTILTVTVVNTAAENKENTTAAAPTTTTMVSSTSIKREDSAYYSSSTSSTASETKEAVAAHQQAPPAPSAGRIDELNEYMDQLSLHSGDFTTPTNAAGAVAAATLRGGKPTSANRNSCIRDSVGELNQLMMISSASIGSSSCCPISDENQASWFFYYLLLSLFLEDLPKTIFFI